MSCSQHWCEKFNINNKFIFLKFFYLKKHPRDKPLYSEGYSVVGARLPVLPILRWFERKKVKMGSSSPSWIISCRTRSDLSGYKCDSSTALIDRSSRKKERKKESMLIVDAWFISYFLGRWGSDRGLEPSDRIAEEKRQKGNVVCGGVRDRGGIVLLYWWRGMRFW